MWQAIRALLLWFVLLPVFMLIVMLFLVPGVMLSHVRGDDHLMKWAADTLDRLAAWC